MKHLRLLALFGGLALCVQAAPKYFQGATSQVTFIYPLKPKPHHHRGLVRLGAHVTAKAAKLAWRIAF